MLRAHSVHSLCYWCCLLVRVYYMSEKLLLTVLPAGYGGLDNDCHRRQWNNPKVTAFPLNKLSDVFYTFHFITPFYLFRLYIFQGKGKLENFIRLFDVVTLNPTITLNVFLLFSTKLWGFSFGVVIFTVEFNTHCYSVNRSVYFTGVFLEIPFSCLWLNVIERKAKDFVIRILNVMKLFFHSLVASSSFATNCDGYQQVE